MTYILVEFKFQIRMNYSITFKFFIITIVLSINQ